MRKRVFRVSTRSDTNQSVQAQKEILDLESKENCTIRVAKTKVLISFAVTAKLICVFVFAYAKCWFSHEAANILFMQGRNNLIYEGKMTK